MQRDAFELYWGLNEVCFCYIPNLALSLAVLVVTNNTIKVNEIVQDICSCNES